MSTKEIKLLADEVFGELIRVRRMIHQNPELAFDEHNTAAVIRAFLEREKIPYKDKVAGTGIAAFIEGSGEGPVVAVRADMDALPITEELESEYKSAIPGLMHACGHDAHIAAALGAGYILNRLRGRFRGGVKLIFQPGEEDAGGADPMIGEGVLDDPKVSAIVAGHVMPELPVGQIRIRHGAVMAAPDDFEIIIKGRGGHGAAPHNTVDPIVTACKVVDVLQSIVSRRIDPTNPCVISVCYFNAGNCNNVIPDTATIGGTVRTLEPGLRGRIEGMMRETVSAVAHSMGAECEFSFDYMYPPVINDRGITDAFALSSEKVVGRENVVWGDAPSMGGEDFAYFLEKIPGTFFHLGCGNEERGIIHPIHSARFDIDEGCIKVGAALFAQFAMDYLGGV